MARSLLDDARYESIGRGKHARSSGGGGVSGDKLKLGVAIGLLAIAALLFAWYYEMIPGLSSRPKPQVITEAEKQQFEAEQKQMQEKIDRGEIIVGGD